MTRWTTLLALSAPLLALAAPAVAEDIRLPVRSSARAPTAHETISDPLEGFNRRMFAVDKRINRMFGRTKVAGSAGVVPNPVRRGLFNFFNNLDEPASFANDTLQLKFGKAAVAAGRFATNSTVGLFGTFDVASKFGMRRHREDLGQTLAKYGVKAGPYIYLPLLGPSTLRDKVGNQVDGMTRPLGFVDMGMMGGQAVSATRKVVQPQLVSVRERARIAADAGQTDDEYATLREFYYEQRADEIADAPGSDQRSSPGASPPPALATTVVANGPGSPLPQPPPVRRARQDGVHPIGAPPPAYGYSEAAYAPQADGFVWQDSGQMDETAEEAAAEAEYDAAHPPHPPPAQMRARHGRRSGASR